MSENNTVETKKRSSKKEISTPAVETAPEVNSVSVAPQEKLTAFQKSDSLPSKSSWLWLKDSTGTPSISATFATVAFWVTTLAYVLSIFESYGQITFRQFDVAACSAYLIPILTLYFSRRWSTDRLNIINNSSKNAENGEKNEQ